MQQDSEMYWADIKNYEQKLEQNPDSFLFARLSEVYLKVQLVDDALHVARQGVAKHPSFVAGQRALAMACSAKGLDGECLQALQRVAEASPDDLEVQKMLGRLLARKGDHASAQKAFNTVLEFKPDDEECRVELSSFVAGTELLQPLQADNMDFGFGDFAADQEEEIIELSESDIVLDSDLETEAVGGTPDQDPLETPTIAELYVQQGFESKAIEIYRSILAENPFNSAARARLDELEAKSATAPADSTASPFKGMEQHMPELPASIQGIAAEAVETLEEWLANIRRIKACR
jgi:tetratricopeptide (TPR) repeat protein